MLPKINTVSILFDRFTDTQTNPLSANPTKLSNTLKQFVGNLPTNCLSAFDHFVGLALKGLKATFQRPNISCKTTLVLQCNIMQHITGGTVQYWQQTKF